MIILPANTLSTGGYEVANSCRFNDDDGPILNKSSGTPSSRRIFTFSCWAKRGNFNPGGSDPNKQLFSIWTDTSNRMDLRFQSGNTIDFYHTSSLGRLTTNRLFRDPSAWYHVCLRVDTTQATAGNRYRLYVNGTQETSFSTETQPSQDSDLGTNFDNITVGDDAYGTSHFDGYLAEVCYCDGQSYAPTEFGEFDEDSPRIWKPKDVSGLTFGTNGFYLDFEDSANLGNDANGGTDLTETNLAATDQATDTPTNNFATLNILDNAQSDATYSEGNLKWQTTTNSHYFWGRSTIGVSAGKWYFEAKLTSAMEHGYIGICVDAPDDNTTFLTNGGANDEFEWGYKLSDGNIYNNTGDSSYGDTYTTGDIIGVYLDLDNNKLYFAKNGTVQNSGTGISITDPASTPTGNYFFCISDGTSGTSGTWEANFGGTNTYTISSGNADDNGYGNFEYSPNITGDSEAKKFYALCTKNLAEYG